MIESQCHIKDIDKKTMKVSRKEEGSTHRMKNVYLDIQDQKKLNEDSDDDGGKGSIWKLLTFLFVIISLILLITLIGMTVIGKKSSWQQNRMDMCRDKNEKTNSGRSRRYEDKNRYTRTNGSDVFEELSRDEIGIVLRYLNSIVSLGLVDPKKATVNSNFIHSIEMKLPDKDNVVNYIKGQIAKPERMALVIIFMGASNPPTVDEYVVGGIGGDVYAHVLNTTARNTRVPFIYRPFSTAEFMAIFRYVIAKLAKIAGTVLKESYDATPMNCGDKCLKFNMAPIASSFLPEGKRKAWFWFQYDIEFPSVRPLDFLVLVDKSSVHPSEWTFEDVWYANQMFPNMDTFLDQYHNGNINKTRLTFPTREEAMYGTLEFREPLMPSEPLRAPRQYEPDGHRFQITDNEIHYMNWKTNFRVSTSGGLQLLNVRFGDERIIYEMSMQEVIVMYGGNNPVSRVMNYADGAGMYGTRFRGLLPGVDCPAQSEFVNTYLYTSNEFGGRIFENAFCVFELNMHTPLRRHRAYGRSGSLYGGLEATVLVIRSIISIVNYDYVFDTMFYQNGGIETKVSMTGYLGTMFHYPEEDAFGTHIYKHVSAALHNHLFNFKVDVDIKGTANRYETVDVKVRTEKDPWTEGVYHTQPYITRSLKESELSAVYKYNFETPKTHVFSNHGHISELGNPRGYRIEIQKMSKQLLPEGYGFENAVPWSRYQMAVTKYKPEEERSSSLFTMWDARDPVVNFQNYLDDDDSLVDQDLVAWVTVGTQHLPQTENLPTTATVGAQMSFFVLPFNYFDEDPSMHSRDAVRITPLDKKNPLDGAKVEQYGALEETNCVPNYAYPKAKLEKNSTFLFS